MVDTEDTSQLQLFKDAPATEEEKRFATTALHLSTLDETGFAVAFGRSPLGLLQKILNASGHLVIPSRRLRLIYTDDRLTGFAVAVDGGEAVIDYADIDAIVNGSGGQWRATFQAGSMQVSIRMRLPAEDLLTWVIGEIDPRRWTAACAAIGVEDKKLRWRVKHRIARALIETMISNCVPPERLGALALLHMIPVGRRQNHGGLLSTARDTDLEKDTLYQLPILILFPNWVSKYFAGQRRKHILDTLNLPRASNAIVIQAVGPIIHLLGYQRPNRDAAPEDLAWLTEALCRAIRDNAPRMFCQRITMNVCCLTFLMSDRDADLAERAGLWAAFVTKAIKLETEFGFAIAQKVARYITADPAELDAAAIPRWHGKASLAATIAAAESYDVRLQTKDLADRKLRLPEWALPNSSIPETNFRLIQIDTMAMLVAEAGRLRNCAARVFANEAERGSCVLYVIRRPARPQDKPSTLHHCAEIGGAAVTHGMLMLRQNGRGETFIAQLAGHANKSVSSAIRAGIELLLG